MKASRGDAIVIKAQISTYVIGAGRTSSTQYTLGIVTNVTRDGLVKKFRDAAYPGSSPRTLDSVVGFTNVLVVPTSTVATADVITAAQQHHYDGHPGQAKPFESIEDVRGALEPYKVVAA